MTINSLRFNISADGVLILTFESEHSVQRKQDVILTFKVKGPGHNANALKSLNIALLSYCSVSYVFWTHF